MMGGPRMGPTPLGVDSSITKQRIKPGTVRRIVPYALRYRWSLAVIMLMTAVSATITASSPLLLKVIIDDGIAQRREGLVVALALAIAGLALVDVAAVFVQT
jgi:ATP-binding cassette subfamily B protein